MRRRPGVRVLPRPHPRRTRASTEDLLSATPSEPCDLPAVELVRLVANRSLAPLELLESCLARIHSIDPAVNAMVTLDEEGARRQARDAGEVLARGGAVGPLHGLPIAIKDTEDTAGMRTTYGSPLFSDHVPATDLGLVARLRAAGAIVIGKTNTPEWAAGANTRNPVHGATGNPFDPSRSAAGSSGGSAVALACGMVPLASGSDLGGSLRNPAAFNGVVGMRPSSGVVASEKRLLGWSNHSVNGPMARDVRDAALMLSVMASDDPRDPLAYTIPGEAVRAQPTRYSPPVPARLDRLRLAYTEDFGFAPTENHVRRVFRARVQAIAPLFAAAVESTPDCTGADRSFAVLRAASFLATHRDNWARRPEMLGPNVRANVEEGLGYTLDDYAVAAGDQTRIYRNFCDFFTEHDVIVSPAITVSPRPWRELYPAMIDDVPTNSYYHWLALAYAVTLSACPAISIPLGVDEAGMPFGLQVVAPRGGDAFLLGVAAAIEEAVADDPTLARPVPDLAALAATAPIAASAHFRDWD